MCWVFFMVFGVMGEIIWVIFYVGFGFVFVDNLLLVIVYVQESLWILGVFMVMIVVMVVILNIVKCCCVVLL